MCLARSQRMNMLHAKLPMMHSGLSSGEAATYCSSGMM